MTQFLWATLGSGFLGFFFIFGQRRTVSLSSWEKVSLLKNGGWPNRSLRCTLFFQIPGVVLTHFEKKVCTVVTFWGWGPFFRMNGRSVGVTLFEKKCAP